MNLATRYAEATEWNLATLSELSMLKSSSQSRIKRQTSICQKMLQVCQEWEPEIDFGDITRFSNHVAPRVKMLLDRAKERSKPLLEVLTEWRNE
jgi:hypothetical protein